MSTTSPMNPKLLEALRRFEHAAEPDIVERWVAWPELSRFMTAAWMLGVGRHRFARNSSVEQDDRRWSIARRLLRSSFIAPNHPDVGLADSSTWGDVADGELGALQMEVRAAVAELLAGPHRSLEAMQQFFSDHAKIAWPKLGLARVVVPNLAIAGTREALHSLTGTDLVTWEVCSLSEAKRLDSCDVTVLAGPPEHFEGWRTEEELRPRRVSWLFNAPMSPHIVAVAWSGSQQLRADRFEPYPGADLLDGRRWVDDGAEDEPIHEAVAPPTSSPPRSATPSAEVGDVVEAIDFELPGGRWISFGTETGPRARRIDDDAEFDVEIESVNASALRRGNTLVIMSSTDDRELRDQLCGAWLASQPERPDFDDATRTVASYKSAARNYLSRTESIRELVRRGMSEQYARSQFHRSHPRAAAMAPQDRRNFEIIAAGAGWTPPADAWTHIEALRAGYMHAGREITKLLAAAVKADSSWSELIDQRELAEVAVEGVGTVTLAPILAVASARSQRTLYELGEIVST